MSQTYYRSSYTRQGSRPSYNSRSNKPKKAYIHPSKFVQTAKSSTQEVYVPKNSFEDFDLVALIKQNLAGMDFSIPSAIQDQAIPHALEGKDIVGIADTGTGKTAAFAVPVLNSLIINPKDKAIILAPTRELAQQIEQQCRVIAKGSGLDGALLIGGEAMGPQLRDLRYNPRIIIGTPGRIKDHIERGSLMLSDCNLIVLDEVDRMLDMGFVNDITFILSRASEKRQSFYFSATLDTKVKNIIDSFSKNTVHISVKSGATSDNVEQNIVSYSGASTKIDKLHDILNEDSTTKAIIFDDTHRSVEKLSKELVARGFSTDAIHGGKSQGQRQRVLDKFKTNKIKVLVATDVAARGLDVSDISHVINFSLPQSYDDYVHRIGRTGRAGKVGYALTFVEKY
jgi:superfamily II DNA/RNA helicase